MQSDTARKESEFWVNREDTPYGLKYRLLAVILSSVPAGTQFSRGKDNLDSRLCDVLSEETNPLITDNFHFHPNYRTCIEIQELLSANLDYGRVIGLKNHGLDFLFMVTEFTHEIAREIEDLQLLDRDQIAYLKDVGKKLLPNR